MKNKDIEKMLAAGKDRILPDESVKSRIADELGYTSSAPALAYAHGGVKTVSNKKRIAIIAAAAAVVMAIVIGIAVPLSLNNGSSPTNPFGNKFLQITDAESFYAYGAASVGALLSGNSDALTSLASVNARGSSVSANAGGAGVLNSRATPNANNALTYTAMPSAGARPAERAVSGCRTACFRPPNGLFRAAKRAVLPTGWPSATYGARQKGPATPHSGPQPPLAAVGIRHPRFKTFLISSRSSKWCFTPFTSW